MTRIDGSSSRPRLPKTEIDAGKKAAAKRPKKEIEGKNEGVENPPPTGGDGVNMTIAGYDRYHRLSRGTNARTWGEGRRAPDDDRPQERVSGPPDPVIPGAKGDHGGLEAPIGRDPTYIGEPEPGPRPIDGGEGGSDAVREEDDEE